MEEDEEAAEAAAAAGTDTVEALAQGTTDLSVEDETSQKSEAEAQGFIDREVGEWVIDALDRRKKGVMGMGPKPALHAAPLDRVVSPLEEVKGAVAVDA